MRLEVNLQPQTLPQIRTSRFRRLWLRLIMVDLTRYWGGVHPIPQKNPARNNLSLSLHFFWISRHMVRI